MTPFLFGKPPVPRFTGAMQVVIDYLKANQERFVTELCEYLRFPSVSAQSQHQPDMLACAEWLAGHCRQIGLTAGFCPTAGHPIVVAKTPRAAKFRPAAFHGLWPL